MRQKIRHKGVFHVFHVNRSINICISTEWKKFSMLLKYVNRSVYIEHMKNAYMKFQESIQ